MSNHLSLKACLVGIAFSALTSASIGHAGHAADAAMAADATPPAAAVQRVELERVVIHARREAALPR
jgi:hypothetical protein